jgi:hypothetical protein
MPELELLIKGYNVKISYEKVQSHDPLQRVGSSRAGAVFESNEKPNTKEAIKHSTSFNSSLNVCEKM